MAAQTKPSVVFLWGVASVFITVGVVSVVRSAWPDFGLWPWDTTLLIGLPSLVVTLVLPGCAPAFSLGAFAGFVAYGVASESGVGIAVSVFLGLLAFLAALAGELLARAVRFIFRRSRLVQR